MRVLLTGLSGVGKTTLVHALRGRGFHAIDMDEPGWSCIDAHGHQRWNTERLRAALAGPAKLPRFVSGCSEDQVAWYPRFDAIILLSAPEPVMLERIASRSGNPYGKQPAEWAEIQRNLREVEPRLRRRASHEIITTQPLESVLEQVLTLARASDVGREAR